MADPDPSELLRQVLDATRTLDATGAARALTAAFEACPSVAGSDLCRGFEDDLMAFVRQRARAVDGQRVEKIVAALASVVTVQPMGIHRRLRGARLLRGAFCVGRAEAMFAAGNVEAAMGALDEASTVYEAETEVSDAVRWEVTQLKGRFAARVGRHDLAVSALGAFLVHVIRAEEGEGVVRACVGEFAQSAAATRSFAPADVVLSEAGSMAWGCYRDAATAERLRALIAITRAELALGLSSWRRELFDELHAAFNPPRCVRGLDAVVLLDLLGALHERLGEMAAARGCFATALSRLGAQRRAHPRLHLELSARYAWSVVGAHDLDELEAWLTRSRNELRAQEEAGEVSYGRLFGAVSERLVSVAGGGRRGFEVVECERLRSILRDAAPGGDDGGTRPDAEDPQGEAVDLSKCDPAALAAPWLAAISPEAPAGVDARDERISHVMALPVELDSPSCDAEQRKAILRALEAEGGALLATRTKNLTLAAYVAYAMHRNRGVSGLLRGLALLVGLIEGYWDSMFPPVERRKARANALAWFVDRTSTCTFAADDEAQRQAALQLVDRLEGASWRHLAAATPSFDALRDRLDAPPASEPR